ncbi:siroheme decarboxylase subunit beta [Pseudomonas sp. MT3]|nr:Lrp/AsnC family transcriptional regulator [uncultured Pseudomonas sp.]
MLDATDRQLILATQSGLPLQSRPYQALADALQLREDEVRGRLARLLACGAIRRIAAVPNHYALGYRANGMSVWDIADDQLERCGRLLGALPYVSHCYQRPRRMPGWPYNLFAMLHARRRATVECYLAEMAGLLGDACRGHEVLYSLRILKKTGLRLAGVP